MIDINTLTKRDKGKWVVFDKGYGQKKGRIKSWNEKHIFVVYQCNDEWNKYKDYTASATDPKDLKFDKAEKVIDEPIEQQEITSDED